MLGFQAVYARRDIKLEWGERLAHGYQLHISASREQAMRVRLRRITKRT